MDETRKQLIGKVHEAIGCAPARPERIDSEYVRNGACDFITKPVEFGEWVDVIKSIKGLSVNKTFALASGFWPALAAP